MARSHRSRLRLSQVALALPLLAGCQISVGTEGPKGGEQAEQHQDAAVTPGTSVNATLQDVDYKVSDADRGTAKAAATSGNRFGDALYTAISGEPGNLFMSPLSVRIALAMTYGGAKGETATEMANVLQLTGEPATIHGSMAALQESLETAAGEGQQLAIANRLWGSKGEPFLSDYLQLTRSYYGAPLEMLDFSGNPEGSRASINSWVGERTQGMIPELLGQGVIDRSTILVLTNAIYFKGLWKKKFDPKRTRDGSFKATGGAVQVPMMSQKAKFRYGESDDAKVLELPYEGDRLSMVIVLPQPSVDLATIEKKMSAEGLAPWLANMDERDVVVTLPRFRVESSFSLSVALQKLGIIKAFGGGDFSGMSGNPGLQISDVIHQAVVEVNEEGTEAAAATAVVMTRSASITSPAFFKADHPFVFAIRDRESSALLFVGRLTTPVSSS